jgi:hypothetical protein
MERKELYMSHLAAASQYIPPNFTASHQEAFLKCVQSAQRSQPLPAHLSACCTIFPPGSILPPTCKVDLASMAAVDRLPHDVAILLEALVEQSHKGRWQVVEPDGNMSFVLKGATGTRLSALVVVNGARQAVINQIVKICTEWGKVVNNVSVYTD